MSFWDDSDWQQTSQLAGTRMDLFLLHLLRYINSTSLLLAYICISLKERLASMTTTTIGNVHVWYFGTELPSPTRNWGALPRTWTTGTGWFGPGIRCGARNVPRHYLTCLHSMYPDNDELLYLREFGKLKQIPFFRKPSLESVPGCRAPQLSSPFLLGKQRHTAKVAAPIAVRLSPFEQTRLCYRGGSRGSRSRDFILAQGRIRRQ